MTEQKTKDAAEPPLDCRVGRDVVAMLRERAARKWTDDANRSASLFGQAADEIERLRGALVTGASLLEQGCNASDMAASMRRAAAVPNA